ncbi:aldo/keto reductase [Planosporangium flavigriseum]|uniref:Oxidoreductase n=1 Tax=Planosporangium flavigriseum TaxID=373681 RepID=A0A8J3LI21_9ACTN|nr:aldo/keto reductase [Planosporangium flavigriseum]GIG73673.1 oxidoreductase [Planosporangium flavigriseum]
MTTATAIRTVTLPSAEPIPVLGQGTWGMAENPLRTSNEIAALRLGVDLGLTLVDTAEMYADGGAETLIGEALADRRDEIFLVDKVLPQNATRSGTKAACERSLRRLRTDRLDMYLLHWRGPVPLDETVAAFTDLMLSGMIRHWGVSNFDLDDLIQLTRAPGGAAVEADQVYYNLAHRGIEWDLLPKCQEVGLPIMAYSPFDHGRMVDQPVLRSVADEHDATPAQIALAWVLRHDGVVTIPKASTPEHVVSNRAAYDIQLTESDLAALDRAFPPPSGPRPLEVL